MKKLVESIIVYTSIMLVLIGSHQAVQSSVGMDEAKCTPVVRIPGSGFKTTPQLDGIMIKYPITATDGTNLANVAFADVVGNDFNATIEVCKMIDIDGINSTTADDTAYTEGWTIYLYKDGGLFDQSQQTTGADGCYTWRDLGPGSYMAIEADVDGWINTGPTNHDFGVVKGNHSYSFTFTNFKLHTSNLRISDTRDSPWRPRMDRSEANDASNPSTPSYPACLTSLKTLVRFPLSSPDHCIR